MDNNSDHDDIIRVTLKRSLATKGSTIFKTSNETIDQQRKSLLVSNSSSAQEFYYNQEGVYRDTVKLKKTTLDKKESALDENIDENMRQSNDSSSLIDHLTYNSDEASEGPDISDTKTESRYIINYDGKLSLRVTKTQSKFLAGDERLEIVKNILDSIISNLDEELEKVQRGSTTLPLPLSSTTIQTTKFVTIKEVIRSERSARSQNKLKDTEKGPKEQGSDVNITSIIQILGLPINTSKPKPFLDGRVKYERVLDDSGDSKTVLSTRTELTQRSVYSHSQLSSIGLNLEEVHDKGAFDRRTLPETSQTLNPFEISWCFGFNADTPVLNLCTDAKSEILFANAQYPVIYNFHEETMQFLDGHHNEVSCMSHDGKGNILATADVGPNCKVIIWDSTDARCLRTLNNVHPNGTSLVALSNLGKHLVTVSPFPNQSVQFWKTQDDRNTPCVSKTFAGPLVKKLSMNPSCEEEFALTFDAGVTFAFYCHKICKEEQNDLVFDTHYTPQKLGLVTDTAFLEGNHSAVSSTSQGYVVTWIEDKDHDFKKIRQKNIRLCSGAINLIKYVQGLVVIATHQGTVNFYDPGLTILYWSTKGRKENLGPLRTLSFNLSSFEDDVSPCEHESHTSCAVAERKATANLKDATLENYPFFTRDFVFSTSSGQLGYFNVSTDSVRYLLYPSKAVYTTIDILPESQFLCAGTSTGQVILIDMSDTKIKVTRQITVAEDQCQAVSLLKYSSSGGLLACGMYTGALWILDPIMLTPKFEPALTFSQGCINHMVFEADEDFLAVADLYMCVAVYCIIDVKNVVLIGQYQAHSGPIRDLYFEQKGGELHLFSLSLDRNITEFIVTKRS